MFMIVNIILSKRCWYMVCGSQGKTCRLFILSISNLCVQANGPGPTLGLLGDVFTTFLRDSTVEVVDYGDVHINEFPRHKLRLMEKLGEGRFGMVSSVINILYPLAH